jgi:drug/metabolite transporter (DMT)-like permease
MPGFRDARVVAATYAILSALLWATYYSFVLEASPPVAASALLPYPFLFGGAAYVGWAFRSGHGRVVLRLLRDPRAWLRIALLIGMQLSILAATFLAGPVDTALLSLVGDVVFTPFLVMWIYRDGRERARSPFFLSGVLLSLAGASLTIVAGGGAGPIRGLAILLAPAVIVTVAFYFLLSAREGIDLPTSAVVGESIFVGGVVSLAISGALPGGFAGLVIVAPVSWLLVIGLGVTSFFAAPALYFAAVQRSGVILPIMLMALIPAFTLGFSVEILHTTPPFLGLVGIPVAVLGGFLALQGTHTPWATKSAPASVGPPGDAAPAPADLADARETAGPGLKTP